MQTSKLGYFVVGASLRFFLQALLGKRAPATGQVETAPAAGDNIIHLNAWRQVR